MVRRRSGTVGTLAMEVLQFSSPARFLCAGKVIEIGLFPCQRTASTSGFKYLADANFYDGKQWANRRFAGGTVIAPPDAKKSVHQLPFFVTS